jgi:hypothetical protein
VSEPTRHHYIPVFYLKRWTGPDGRLCEYSRPYKETKAKRKHPAATAYVEGLYTVSGLPPERTQFVEKQFMQMVDSGAAEALTAMLKRTAPAGNEEPDWIRTIYWARFVYLPHVPKPFLHQRLDPPGQQAIHQFIGVSNGSGAVFSISDTQHLISRTLRPMSIKVAQRRKIVKKGRLIG